MAKRIIVGRYRPGEDVIAATYKTPAEFEAALRSLMDKP